MWIFSIHGFFSAVSAREGKSGYGKVDATRIMVRARVRAHLERLASVYPEQLAGREILESPGNDYRWRVFMPKEVWAQVMASLALDTDYDNFKSEAGRQWPKDDAGYVHMLHGIWSRHADMQTNGAGKKVGAYSTKESYDPYADQFRGKGRKAGDRTLPKATGTGTLPFSKYIGETEPLLSDADLEDLRASSRENELMEPFVDVKPVKQVTVKTKEKKKPKAPAPVAPPAGVPAEADGYKAGLSRYGKPKAHEFVLLIYPDASDDVGPAGIVWWISEMESPEAAYAEAVKAGILPSIPSPVFGLVERGQAEADYPNVPVYDWRALE